MVDTVPPYRSDQIQLPVAVGPKGPMLCITYQGKSMHPLFLKGDKLLFDPTRSIHKGDIIAFQEPSEGNTIIIHRVIQELPGSIRTAGDNNRFIDPYVTPKTAVFGVVCYLQRGGFFNPVRGGLWGTISYHFHPVRKRVILTLTDWLRPLYLHISEKGMFCRITSRFITITERTISSSDGKQTRQLIWNRVLIGSQRDDQKDWYIRPPFRLCIDPKALKKAPSPEYVQNKTHNPDMI